MKRPKNFKTLESLAGVEKIINEAGAALRDTSRTIGTSSIPEVLGGVAGAGVGAAVSFAALYTLGTAGLSAAGITSGLAAAGAVVGGGMVAGIGVLAAPVAVLAVSGYGILAHRKHKKLLHIKEELLRRAIQCGTESFASWKKKTMLRRNAWNILTASMSCCRPLLEIFRPI